MKNRKAKRLPYIISMYFNDDEAIKHSASCNVRKTSPQNRFMNTCNCSENKAYQERRMNQASLRNKSVETNYTDVNLNIKNFKSAASLELAILDTSKLYLDNGSSDNEM